MPVIDPYASFQAALPSIINESPSQIHRRRETTADTFSAPTTYTQGPYTVRIDPFRATSAKDVWDEKGGVAVALFQLTGCDLPRTVEEGGATVPLFTLGDRIDDGDGNQYRVVAPPFLKDRLVQLTLELRG